MISDFVFLVSAASVIAALVRLFSSESPLKKQIDGAVGVILLVAVLGGGAALVGSLRIETPSSPEEYGDAFSATAEEALAIGIKEAVVRELSIPEELVQVSVLSLELETLVAEKIELTLRGSAVTLDYRRIRDYVSSLGHGECEVKISFA